MLIGELARAAGVDSQTIRFYERRGLLPPPARAANGYRVYAESAVPRLLFIRGAQAAGLTLTEIGSVVGLRDDGQAPCAHVDELLRRRLGDVRARQAELAGLESELERLITRSRRLDPADCADSEVCQILSEPGRPRPPG